MELIQRTCADGNRTSRNRERVTRATPLRPRLFRNYDYNYRQMHRGTMKCDNSFPMTINYRINSGARGRTGRGGGRATRNCLFCEINFSALSQKRLLLDRIEFFFRDWQRRGGREGRDASITLNDQFFFFGRHACKAAAHARVFVVRIKFDKSQRVASIGQIIGAIFHRAE